MGHSWLRSFPILFFFLIAVNGTCAATPEQEMMETVTARLLDVVEPIPGYDDPPLCLKRGTGVRASIAIRTADGRKRVTISLSPDLLERVVRGDRDVLALIVGHQLAHLVLGHAVPEEAADGSIRRPKPLGSLEEEAAEWKAAELLVRAGFSLRRALRGVARFQEASPEAESFDGWAGGIASWEDRLARFDREQIPLAKQMSAWKTGAICLATEQFLLADMCFERVTEEFPACSDAWVGLGYAKLMRYFDGLALADLGESGVGMVVSRGFRRRIADFEPPFRHKNVRLWLDAVEALNEGLRQNPERVRARAALGLAYLFHPRGPQLDRARELLQAAAEAAEKEVAFSRNERAEILFNLAVVLQALGDSDGSRKTIGSLESLYRGEDSMPLALRSALAYRRALLLSAAKRDDARSSAIDRWVDFLEQSDPISTWWELAFLNCEKLRRSEGKEPLERSRLYRQAVELYRRPALRFEPDPGLVLGGPVDGAIRKRGRPRTATAVRNTNLARLTWEEEGLEVLAADAIFAIRFTKEKSPSILLGDPKKLEFLRVGMKATECARVLGTNSYDWMLIDSELSFRFYPERGIAVRIEKDRIVEIAIVPVAVP